jgi:hypothetical protein
MTWRRIALLVLFQGVLLQAARQNTTSSIEGTVVRLGTNEPIEDARVFLMKVPADASASQELMTGRDGRFTFKDLAAGTYRLLLAANGFVRQEFGQRVLFGKGTPIEILENQARRGILVRMTPTGTVSGRMTDKENNPLSGVSVQLLRYGYNEHGERALRSFGKAQTNDLGEYRIYFISPGKYFLSVTETRDYIGRNQVRESYIPVFYPGVRNVGNASPIEISPGVERRGIDVTLQRQERPFVVRGRVVDSATGRPPENIGGLYLDSSDVSGVFDRSQNANPAYQDGVFEFRNVAPGRYVLSAMAYEPGPRDRSDRIAQRRVGMVPVEVSNSDVTGIEVALHPGFTISGRIRQENSSQPTTGLSSWNISTGGPPQGAEFSPLSTALPSGWVPEFSSLNEDGTFQVLNVLPGEYSFSIGWLQDQYIKEARFGGMDILNRPLRFTGSESGTLEVVLSPNMGAIEGKVVNQRLEEVAAAQVVLVPDQRERTTFFRAVTTDAKGRFNMPQVAPGEYTLFAWEALEPFQYFDPDLLRRSESRGLRVHVSELSKQTINVPVIPAAF